MCMYLCVCMYVYTCIWMYVGVYMCHVCVLIPPLSVCVWSHVTVIADLFVRFELNNGRFKFVPVMGSIDWRFEDWPTRWSGDPSRFVQWRPYSDSGPKSRHFMLVFILMLFPYLLLPVGVHVAIRIISCDFFLLVWLVVSFHETLVIVHLICVIDMSLYHFMCWWIAVVDLGLVLIYRRPDLTL